jgi:hypothetical protein
MTTYQIIKEPINGKECAVLLDGHTTVPLNAPDNTDYQAYLKWLADGNTPLPAENA